MMKNMLRTLLLILAASLAVYQAEAQLKRGNLLVGGNIADLDAGLRKGDLFSASLSPKIAWFLRDNAAVGGYLKFGLATAKNAGTSINYGIGLLGRYYLSNDNTNLYRHGRFFGEANVGIEGFNPAVGENTNGLGLGIGPGYAYFVSPNVGLETLLKYNGIVGFGQALTSHNLHLSFGFQIYLPVSGRSR